MKTRAAQNRFRAALVFAPFLDYKGDLSQQFLPETGDYFAARQRNVNSVLL